MVLVKNISFSYGKSSLFRNLSLQIQQGNIYGLLGMNGAGKTTLLRLIAGQLFRHAGTMETHGFDPKMRDPRMLANIYYLPEESVLPNISASYYVKIYAPFYPKFSMEAYRTYGSQFDLPHDKPLNQLSYGEKKKFLLCFGLASGTSLLLLDEPTNGLDIPSKSQFRRIIASAMDDQRAFIISTHQVRDMDNLIDPVIILHGGTVIFHHSLDEVSRSISVSFSRRIPEQAEYLYAEQVPGGFSVISKRMPQDNETSIDLETLFNTAVSAPQKLREVLGGATS